MTADITLKNGNPNLYVVPDTGEVLDTSDTAAMALAAKEQPQSLAGLMETIDEHIRLAQEARAYIAEFLIERMDQDATQTLHAGDFTLTVNGSSDEYETFDAEELRAGLQRLVDEGVLSAAGADKAVRVKYEASKSGINSLRALRDDAIERVLDASRQTATRRRRVSVKRAR